MIFKVSISAFLILFIFVLLNVSKAYAWGNTGHRVIGDLTYQGLHPTVQKQVDQLLKIKGINTLGEGALWADEVKHQLKYKWTKRLHFVNLPSTASQYIERRDCPKKKCIVTAIPRFYKELTNKRLKEKDRAEALMFLIHFIGDIHQPLHAGFNSNRGGNDIEVRFYGMKANLHKVWDVPLVDGFVAGAVDKIANRKLSSDRGLDCSNVNIGSNNWSKSLAKQWANESFRLAKLRIYPATENRQQNLQEDYYQMFKPVVNERLCNAIHNSVMVINQALK